MFVQTESDLSNAKTQRTLRFARHSLPLEKLGLILTMESQNQKNY